MTLMQHKASLLSVFIILLNEEISKSVNIIDRLSFIVLRNAHILIREQKCHDSWP